MAFRTILNSITGGGGGFHIFEDHPTPFINYWRCGSQVPPWRLRNRHYDSDKFRIGEEHQSRQKTLQHFLGAILVSISVNSEPMEPVMDFLYLVRTFLYNNSDWVDLN